MKPKKAGPVAGGADWTQIRGTPAWQSWAGLAFENVCWKHIGELKRTLQIGAVQTSESPWRQGGGASTKSKSRGAQIDLLIVRRDDIIHLCEMKYTQVPFVIRAAYKRELLRKIEYVRRFDHETGSRDDPRDIGASKLFGENLPQLDSRMKPLA